MTLEAEPRNRYQETNRKLIDDVIACSNLGDEPNDVLCANGFFRVLPGLIRDKESETLVSVTEAFGEEAKYLNLEDMKPEEVRVAQRDLSMAVTASTLVLRHSDEVPNADEIVPKAAKQLVRLSKFLDVPARTTDGNWTGANPRFFTDTTTDINGQQVKAEALIKICVGRNWEKQESTINNLVELSGTDVQDERLPKLIAQTSKDFSLMVSSVSVLRTGLTNKPEGLDYFLHEFLPMTMPYKIDGKNLIHSGSQYLPSHFLDTIVGVTDQGIERHVSYLNETLISAPSARKDQYAKVLTNIGTYGTLKERVLGNPGDLKSVREFHELMKILSQFRKAHVEAIDRSAPQRPNGESSGGQISMAHDLRDRTISLRDALGEIVRQK